MQSTQLRPEGAGTALYKKELTTILMLLGAVCCGAWLYPFRHLLLAEGGLMPVFALWSILILAMAVQTWYKVIQINHS